MKLLAKTALLPKQCGLVVVWDEQEQTTLTEPQTPKGWRVR